MKINLFKRKHKFTKYYHNAISFDSLLEATFQCSKGVKWKNSVQQYLRRMLWKTTELREQLLKGTYKIKDYVIFDIYVPKHRKIFSTKFRDRIIQRSLCNNGFYRLLTKHFIYDSCACQKNKGVHFARKRLKVHLYNYYWENKSIDGWVLKLDVHHFFPSIPHSVAKHAVDKRVPDKFIKQRVYDIIDSFRNQYPDNPKFGCCGLALGSQMSQLIALSVLDDLDHFIKEELKIKHYIRYMDDMILIHPDKRYLKYCWDQIKIKLDEIGLTLNKSSNLYNIKQGVIFLKMKYALLENGKIKTIVPRKNIINEKRKLKKLMFLRKDDKITNNDLKEHYTSWSANIKKTNSKRYVKVILNYLRCLYRQIVYQPNCNS